jgi:hypothetical protein
LIYCRSHKVEYEGDDCPSCEVDSWKADRAGGWFVLFILFPFALVGFLSGLVWEGLKVGFGEAVGAWPKAMAFIRKERPGLKVSSKD